MLRLEDFLESFGCYDLEMLLEIKDRKVVPGLVKVLDHFPSGVKSRIIVGSFDAPLLRDFKTRLPHLRTSLQLGTVFGSGEMIELARKFLCQFVHPCWEARAYYPHELLPAETVEALHRAGLKVIVWHEERPEFLRTLLELPVYGICTNDPLLLKNLRDRAKDHAS